MNTPLRTIVWLLFFLAAAPFLVHAQIPSFAESVEIKITPRVPQPNARVEMSVTSYSFDIDRSTIRWSVGGKEISSGVGNKQIEVTAGDIGSTVQIGLTIITPQNTVIERTISVPIGSIDLIIEADTYVPPFYRGRAMPTYGASVRLIAFPNSSVSTDRFLYRWERDYEVMEGLIGTANNVAVIRSPEFSARTAYAVEAASVNPSVRLRRDFALANVEPSVVLYEDNPLGGIQYERAVQTQSSLAGKEVTYVAEPFFFSAAGRNDGKLSYEWTLDGESVNTGAKDFLTLRQDVEGEGSASIGLSIQNSTEILQTAAVALTLFFGQEISL